MALRSLFFFDDWCLARRDNLVRRLGRPRWVPEATYEDPTAETPFSYPAVYYDSQLERWRLFYLGRRTLPPPGYRRTEWLLTAESGDGFHWERPDLTKRVLLPQRNRPHEVFDARYLHTGGSVFLDETAEERRFKWLFLEGQDPNRPRQTIARLAYSADGYAWTIDPEVRWHPGRPDPGIFLFRNAEQGLHTVTVRPRLVDRRIAFVDTPDWQTWTTPEVVLQPDALDPPLCELYGMPVFPYEGMYIGFLWLFQTDPQQVDGPKLEGKVYGELVYSYYGRRFMRSLREPFVGLNEPDEYGSGCIYPSSMVVDAEKRIRIYSGGTKGEHYQARSLTEPRYAAILMHLLRQDGFVYLESAAGAGYLTTRWARLNSDRLLLNIQAPNGEVKVQLSDLAGQPLPGYTFDGCVPFRGDSLAWQPQWKDHASLAEMVGRPLRIDVQIYHGRLYSIRGDIELVYVEDLS